MRKHARIIIPAALMALFLLGGWTLRNKLAADRQGDWVRATRGDLVTGFEVIGTLASSASESLGPPPVDDMWNFKISRLAREGSEVKKGQPVLAFDTTELQRLFEQKSAEADESRKQIEKERNDLSLQSKDERLRLSIPRAMFNILAPEGELEDWREAYGHGHLKVEGDPKVQQLIGQVIERQLARSRLKRAR